MQNFWWIISLAFLLMAALETAFPATNLGDKIYTRWLRNFSVLIVNGWLMRLLLMALGFAYAFEVAELEFGLLSQTQWPFPVLFIVSLLLLDFKQYLFHRSVHRWDLLWRIHKVHHAQDRVDLTSGWFFHPLEALLNLLVDLIVILLTGIPAEAYIAYIMLAHLANLWEHANIRLPALLEHILSWVIITPALHHTHHSLDISESNMNYGNIFSFWDRVLCTLGYAGTNSGLPVQYGIEEIYSRPSPRLWELMLLPFRRFESDARQLPREGNP